MPEEHQDNFEEFCVKPLLNASIDTLRKIASINWKAGLQKKGIDDFVDDNPWVEGFMNLGAI